LLVGWGRVYKDDLWVARFIGEPAHTDFIEYFSMNSPGRTISLKNPVSRDFLQAQMTQLR